MVGGSSPPSRTNSFNDLASVALSLVALGKQGVSARIELEALRRHQGQQGADTPLLIPRIKPSLAVRPWRLASLASVGIDDEYVVVGLSAFGSAEQPIVFANERSLEERGR